MIIESLLVAISLCADCFAVSLCSSLTLDVFFYTGIAAAEVVFIPQTAEYSPNGVALLARNFAVILQPFVNHGNEISQHRITRWLGIRQIVLTPVKLVGVLLDGFK